MISEFDSFLDSHDETLEATVIGAAALVLLDVVIRQTIDVDCLSPKIPERIRALADEFRKARPDLDLIPNWLNNGPDSLLRDLPLDWKKNAVTLFEGKSIKFTTLGRLDLLKTKLFAYCDRGDDFKDCIAMRPSAVELEQCIDWVKERDINPNWPEHVIARFEVLKKKLGHE